MEGQLNAYLAQQEAPSDFDIDFYMGMSKGTVRVRGNAEMVEDADEDGRYRSWTATNLVVTWAFDNDFDADYDEELVDEKVKEFIENFCKEEGWA